MNQIHHRRLLGAERTSPVTRFRVSLFHTREHRLKERMRFARGCSVTRACARARTLMCEELGPGDSQHAHVVYPRKVAIL